ncbi:MAG: alpha/beta hydrolase [Rhodospirillales bacterium 69-11]|nr:alpha/beta fold hydrolase [Rhodospirillales bacterium]MBN8925437.1 alpha/beta fold hydrolase [Rhodospirillales bacterium]OJW25418.1 MAG: alpha/beta hydrolase [Rhodospirillales bacterium 69-11]
MILNAIQSGEGPPVVLLHGLFGQARNFGTIQRALAPRFRVTALDMRNHGASPHGADMAYPTQAADVLETLAHLGIGRAAVIGHSMGGKAAMAAALAQPATIGRLLVSDIAPVPYQHGNADIAAALTSVPLTPGLTRAQAEAALAPLIPDPTLRPFLLQNLSFGPTPAWRIGLDEIAASVRDLEGWRPIEGRYEGPALFVAGERSDYIPADARPIIRGLFPAARFVTVKNAGHWVHADNPAGFLSVLEAFLASWEG